MITEFALLLLGGIGIAGGLLLFHVAHEEIAPGSRYFRFLLSALFLVQAILLMLSKNTSQVGVESWMVYAGVGVGFFVAFLVKKPFGVVGGSVGIGAGLSFSYPLSGVAFLLMMVLEMMGQEKKIHIHTSFSHAAWFLILGALMLMVPSPGSLFSVLQGFFIGGCLFHGLQSAKPVSLLKSDSSFSKSS